MIDTESMAPALLASCAAVPDWNGRGDSVSQGAIVPVAPARRSTLTGTSPA